MRIGKLEIRLTAATKTGPSKPAGASGTVNQDGYIVREEWNPELRGKEGLRTYRKMRKGDTAVREAEQHIFAPIKNATWVIEPYSDEPDDLRIAAAVEAAYFKWPSRPFSQHLHQALTALSMGFQVFEYAWQAVDDELSYDDPTTGEPVMVPRTQYVTFNHFSQRLPETIWEWRTRDGELVTVVQQAMKNGEYGNWNMDADNLLVFTHEQEGDDFEGHSILRNAYEPWFLKRIVSRVTGTTIERQGMGVWVVYPPESKASDTDEIDRLEDIFTKVGLGDSPYIIMPGPYQNGQQPGYYVELMSTTSAIEAHIKFLEYLRGEIKGMVLARFAELGHGSVGARATGDVQSEVWYDALHSTANWFAEVHNMRAIPRFVRMNFGVERFPRLVAQNIESRSLEEFANAHYRLVSGGAIVADKGYRDYIRRETGAPDEDEETAEQLAEEEIEEEPGVPPGDEPPPDDTEEEQ